MRYGDSVPVLQHPRQPLVHHIESSVAFLVPHMAHAEQNILRRRSHLHQLQKFPTKTILSPKFFWPIRNFYHSQDNNTKYTIFVLSFPLRVKYDWIIKFITPSIFHFRTKRVNNQILTTKKAHRYPSTICSFDKLSNQISGVKNRIFAYKFTDLFLTLSEPFTNYRRNKIRRIFN